jgi:hypothetical protein
MVSGVPLTVAVPVVVIVPELEDDGEAALPETRMAAWLAVAGPPDTGGGFDV